MGHFAQTEAKNQACLLGWSNLLNFFTHNTISPQAALAAHLVERRGKTRRQLVRIQSDAPKPTGFFTRAKNLSHCVEPPTSFNEVGGSANSGSHEVEKKQDYLLLLERQGGGCAICKSPSRDNWVVDQDPTTNQIRGLICHSCKGILGQLKDNIPTIQAAIHYLQRTGGHQSWDAYFLQIAALAATRSKDPSSQIGAVLVRDRNIISTGYNGFPRGVDDSVVERYERPLKYQWVVHAEENCLLTAARNGVMTQGTTLYVTPLFPCSRCATSIVQAGIKEVVSNDHLRDNPRWKDDFQLSSQIFSEAGVIVRPPT